MASLLNSILGRASSTGDSAAASTEDATIPEASQESDEQPKQYTVEARNKVNRYRDRAVYDCATIHSIIDTSPVLHVSFSPTDDDPFPTILPMIGCTGTFPQSPSSDEDNRNIYLHGYVSSRLMRLGKEGTPVCIAATHVDGVVLALTPHDSSNNYRSVVIHGYAHLVTDEAEKLYAMESITNNVVPQRAQNSRWPPTKTELTGTGILRVEIETASAKVRAGQPHSGRNDLKDEDVTRRTWTGVVPMYMQYGEPVADETNKVTKVPEYLARWVRKENVRMKDQAVKAMEEPAKKAKQAC